MVTFLATLIVGFIGFVVLWHTAIFIMYTITIDYPQETAKRKAREAAAAKANAVNAATTAAAVARFDNE